MTVKELIHYLLATNLRSDSLVVLHIAQYPNDRFHIYAAEEDTDNTGVIRLIQSNRTLEEHEVGYR